MRYTNSSWFPLKNFSKSPMNFDWMMGISAYFNVKDSLSGKKIKRNSTVFWNRTLNANVTLESYNEAVKGKDKTLLERLKELELPTDIRIV